MVRGSGQLAKKAKWKTNTSGKSSLIDIGIGIGMALQVVDGRSCCCISTCPDGDGKIGRGGRVLSDENAPLLFKSIRSLYQYSPPISLCPSLGIITEYLLYHPRPLYVSSVV